MIVAIDVLQPARQLTQRTHAEATVFLQALSRTLAQLVECHPAVRDADDRHAEFANLDQRL